MTSHSSLRPAPRRWVRVVRAALIVVGSMAAGVFLGYLLILVSWGLL